MDAELFDLFARKFGLQTARRAFVSMLVGGTLGSVLSGQDTAAARRRVAADKRKKRKKRKNKKKKKHTNPPPAPRDEAPPCTFTSCSIPPGCSQQALDTCSTSLFDEITVAAQDCQAVCQDTSSQACQACIDPIVATFAPRAVDCLESSCGALLSRKLGQIDAASRDVTAEAWWTRTCDKACCHASFNACMEDVTENLFVCLAGAIVTAATAGPAALPVLASCLAWLLYHMRKCQAREGCENDRVCVADDVCCEYGGCSGQCCPPGGTCTTGTSKGVPRSACCEPMPGMLGACDGVCCATPASVTKCCPGNSNPCNASSVPC